jgi:hypothetical protein
MEQLTQQQREEIVNDDQQFKLHVMECLGELRADMKSIVGNGQPGRLNKLEDKVNKHDLYIAGAVGAAVLLTYILQYCISLLPVMLG